MEVEDFLVSYLARWNGETHRSLVFALLANVHPRPLERTRGGAGRTGAVLDGGSRNDGYH